MNSQERYSRQASIVPMDKLEACKATIVGVGAIGRNAASQLASIGVQDIQLIDFDQVEESNIASQGYHEGDLGQKKIDATAKMCQAINSGINIQKIDGRFSRRSAIGNVLFFCVDSIETREFIWNSVKDRVDFFVDGRMAAETLRVLSGYDDESKAHYATTLFREEEAHQGSCTAKTTVYCANIAAGFMVSSFTKWLRDVPTEPDILVNLFANELSLP